MQKFGFLPQKLRKSFANGNPKIIIPVNVLVLIVVYYIYINTYKYTNLYFIPEKLN